MPRRVRKKDAPMNNLSEEGNRLLSNLAARYGLSLDAVRHLLMALVAGQTHQAQFNHPELGGMGQWSDGGMIMIGDMFNNGLKATIANLASELAGLVRGSNIWAPAPQSFQSQSQNAQGQYQGGGVSLFVPGAFSQGNWWPGDLGQPSSTGAQNNLRYAFFPASRRLAIDLAGKVTIYDTRDHQIGGFSQQQGGDQSLSFNSQYGLVRVADLDIVAPADPTAAMATAPDIAEPVVQPENPFVARQAEPVQPWQPAPPEHVATTATAKAEDDIFGKIERLAALHGKGILTDQEFEAKKAELLSRI
jgi:hypothetical protein